jgi:hypothetical protein
LAVVWVKAGVIKPVLSPARAISIRIFIVLPEVFTMVVAYQPVAGFLRVASNIHVAGERE